MPGDMRSILGSHSIRYLMRSTSGDSLTLGTTAWVLWEVGRWAGDHTPPVRRNV